MIILRQITSLERTDRLSLLAKAALQQLRKIQYSIWGID